MFLQRKLVSREPTNIRHNFRKGLIKGLAISSYHPKNKIFFDTFFWQCLLRISKLRAWPISFFEKIHHAGGQTKSKLLFQADVSSKKRTNGIDFTTKIPLVDFFSFLFWKKLKTPKRQFEINWPLELYYRLWAVILFLNLKEGWYILDVV